MSLIRYPLKCIFNICSENVLCRRLSKGLTSKIACIEDDYLASILKCNLYLPFTLRCLYPSTNEASVGYQDMVIKLWRSHSTISDAVLTSVRKQLQHANLVLSSQFPVSSTSGQMCRLFVSAVLIGIILHFTTQVYFYELFLEISMDNSLGHLICACSLFLWRFWAVPFLTNSLSSEHTV